MIKNQNFGIEIEMTGITRETAAKKVAQILNSTPRYIGLTYDRWEVTDDQGRTWKIMYDSSIRTEKNLGRRNYIPVYDNRYRVELVSPICTYEDIELVQELTRALRKRGAKVNDSCSVHVHVDASNHNVKSIKNITNLVNSKEELIFEALNVKNERKTKWCKKNDNEFVEKINQSKITCLNDLAYVWYKGNISERSTHYSQTRYHALNLHNVWYRGTIEFRHFNGSLHAGEIKTYIQFVLAVSAKAINAKTARAGRITAADNNKKEQFRYFLKQIGLVGEEFSTARLHLMKHLEGRVLYNERRAA